MTSDTAKPTNTDSLQDRPTSLEAEFMYFVKHPTNPLTKRDLVALIAKRPNVYGRFAGFMDKLPD